MNVISFRLKGICIALALAAAPTAMVHAQKTTATTMATSKTTVTTKVNTDVRNAAIQHWVDNLTSTGLSEADAEDLARRIVANDSEAIATAKLIIAATGTTQTAGVTAAENAKLVAEIKRRRLTDSSKGGAADGLIGRVVIEELLGKNEASKLPGYAQQRAGEVARSLLEAKAKLQLVGEDETSGKGKQLLQDIVGGALTGNAATNRIQQTIDPIIAAARKAQEDAAKPGVAAKPGSPSGAKIGGVSTPAVVSAPKNINADKIKQGAAINTGKLSSGMIKAGVGSSVSGNIAGGNANAARTGSGAAAGNVAGAASGSAAAGGAQSAANDINFGRNSRITGGDGTGTDAGSKGGHFGANSDPSKGSGTSGNGTGAGSGRNPDGGAGGEGGGGSGGGTGGSSGAGSGTGGGSGGGSGSGEGSGGGGGDGAGAGGGSGGSGEGSGGGDNGGGTGETQNHERTDYELDLSGDGMTVEYVDGTPLAPGMENDHGTGTELHEATGGRIGGTEARSALRGVSLQGGATVTNPAPDSKSSSGVLLTPEEQNNAGRAIDFAKGGGVTDPSDGDIKGTAVTDRDLKELDLRGNGGAKGPSESGSTGAAPPQDARSPIVGNTPAPVVGGQVKVQGVQNTQKVNVNIKSEVAR